VTSQILRTQGAPALTTWVRLLRGYSAATKELSALLAAEHDLTINDYEALLHLLRAEGNVLRRVDLAASLLLTPSGVTRLLEGLERAGYVEKATCESDARVTYARLTDAGRDKVEEASGSHVAAVRRLFEERFSERELVTLARLLERLPGAGGADGSECEAEG
jgi:DNA-binding MarR family transcriptional regulator